MMRSLGLEPVKTVEEFMRDMGPPPGQDGPRYQEKVRRWWWW
jgi:hypothetical protein